MKKFLFAFFLPLLLAAGTARAQDVYNLVLENATRTVNSPTSGFTQTRIAQFKRTALVYLKSKCFERSDSVSTELLNTQAYYMSEFLSLFFKEILKDKKQSEAKRKAKVLLFMDASASNPLFNDPDKETTLSYVTGGGELTPFSLDTDWQKAYFAARSQL